jgi:dsRNA-specific ribonuclease
VSDATPEPDALATRAALEALLGHRFDDPRLLDVALAHPSFAHE